MNWLTFNKLNEIYSAGKTKLSEQFIKDDTISQLIGTEELYLDGRSVVLDERQAVSFRKYYEKCYLNQFSEYSNLLQKYDLLTDRNGRRKTQVRFEEHELKVLLGLDEQMVDGSILDLRDQIIEKEESIRGVSRMFFFNNEKYLDNKEDVIEAFKRILKIDKLANDKGQQWIYKLTAPKRNLIVLCENLDFLRRPTRPRKNNIELWYAGGANTPKLIYEIDLIDVPIFYSCDWDHDGLNIFLRVKELLPMIKLLTPICESIKLSDTPNHHSYWEELDEEKIGEIPNETLCEDHKRIVFKLIGDRAWLREEDSDLIEMLIREGAI